MNRTCNPQIRSLVLYPVELQAQYVRSAQLSYHLLEEYQALLLCWLEVPVRVEPTLIELQSIALPLG